MVRRIDPEELAKALGAEPVAKRHLQQPTKCKLCFRRFCDHSAKERGIEWAEMWECSPSCWCKK